MPTTTTVPCACGCGDSVPTPDARGRARRYLRGHAGRPGGVRLPTGQSIIVCVDCGQTRRLEGRGRCRRCYEAARRAAVIVPNPPLLLLQADPATRLPIPPQARCPGCPDVPVCPRAVLPGTGYCLRCGQLMMQASQAA